VAQLRPGGAKPDGVLREALARIPVARRDHHRSELYAVAELTHQLGALYAAERELGMDLRHLTDALRERMECRVAELLGLSENEARALEEEVRASCHRRPEGPSLFRPWTPLPPRPALCLLDDEERARLQTWTALPKSGPEWSEPDPETIRLLSKQHWERVLEQGPPRELDYSPEGTRTIVV
jgi:hypothetical protein